MEREIKVCADVMDLLAIAAERIVEAAERAIADTGRFSIALSGGRTPKGLYELLASPAYKQRIDWPLVSIYFGDERCVPPDSDQSNYRMANEALLSRAPLHPENVHRMAGEADPKVAAREYGQLLQENFGDAGIDLILLGMGDDGHTASLFPGTAALAEKKHRCVENFVPKLNAWRLTLSAPFINKASAVMFLISGHDKAAVLKEVLEGPHDPQRLPSQLIAPGDGTLTYLLDPDAAGMRDEE